MKRLAWQSLALIAALLLFCLIGRLIMGNTYTAYFQIYQGPPEDALYHIAEEPGKTGSLRYGDPKPGKNYISLQVHAEKPGEVLAWIQDENNRTAASGFFQVGRFHTIYDRNTGGFTGDRILLIALTIFFLGEGLLMFLAFCRAKGPDFYRYTTIYTAGFSIFLFLTGLMMLMGTVRHILHPGDFIMLSVYDLVASASSYFMSVTFPLVLVFAIAMTVSNLELLRHERRRLANVLGILISILMVLVPLVGFSIMSMNFAGSSFEYHLLRTFENTYSTIFVYFECMLLGSIICGILAARHMPEGAVDYILILGCGFRKDGTLPPLLKGRVDKAISFWKRQKELYGKDAILVPSGGQGRDEVMPEAEAMQNYLLSQGIPKESILPETQSANTYQNMAFSKKLINEKSSGTGQRIVYSTTNYHVFRSGVWAGLADLKAEGIGSSTKWWFWPNAFMRECVGLLANRWKQELVLLAILVGIFAGLSMLIL